MSFVSRDIARLVSNILILVLKASHLVRLVKGLVILSRGLDSSYPRDEGLSILASCQ